MAIVWGVNGHTMVGYPTLSTSVELDSVQSAGLRTYRMDIYNDSSDTPAKNILRAAVDGALTRGITILPCLITRVEQFADDTAVYNGAFTMGAFWATNFPDVLTWEVNNESEIKGMMVDGTSGALSSHYTNPLYTTYRSSYFGCIDGIRSVMPNARIVVNTSGWHHYGFLQRLWADGVRWDVSGFHWYSEMGDAANFDGGTNHFQILKTSFGKPIYVTEVNARPLSMASRQAESTWLINTMTQWDSIASTYDIQAVYIYELLDEPERAASDPPEAIYGLYTETGVIKTMGTDVKTYLTANPSADPFALDSPPFVTRSVSTSPLATFRSNIQVGVSGAIRDTHIHGLIDAIDQTTAAPISTKTASYTAAAADNGGKIIFNSASAVTFTLPSTLPVNWECAIVQLGTGQVTIQTSGGTSALRSRTSHTKTAGRYAQAYATVVSNTNGTAAQVVLTGDTAV